MTRGTRINLLLIAVVVGLAVVPLAIGAGDGADEPFGGADARAQGAIEENAPAYEPWFAPVYEPPSGEVASGLFALQAALGGGVVAYYFGLRRGRRQGAAAAEAAAPAPVAGEADGRPVP
ncbi:energy-coupling factor ABC transporter substrate-binding protein [Streptomyces sp. TR06-5]|uniref:energy-coupling factor ABC transporter substrate-binding protein n=1 Tax=unclassified Streptomyces TaxID=2593676 RepID=UPI00399F48B4